MIEITYAVFAAVTLLIWVVVRTAVYLKTGNFSKKHELKLLLWLFYLLIVARGVYFPLQSTDGRAVRTVIDVSNMFPPKMNLKPFNFFGDFYPGWEINVLGNIFIFIPVGLFFPECFRGIDRFWKDLIAGFGFTFVIEFTQLFLYDRCSDVDDLILNTFGAAIGAAAWFGLRKYREKKEKGHLA